MERNESEWERSSGRATEAKESGAESSKSARDGRFHLMRFVISAGKAEFGYCKIVQLAICLLHLFWTWSEIEPASSGKS
jgi:hypothetical protein